MWLTSGESESHFHLVLAEIKLTLQCFVCLWAFWTQGLTSVKFGWRGHSQIYFVSAVFIPACWQSLWSVSLALIRHQKTHARAQFPDNRALVTSFYGFCCSKVICASFKWDGFATRLCLMETWFYSRDYSTGKMFPGWTGQQGHILPASSAVLCSPWLSSLHSKQGEGFSSKV